MWVSIGVVGNRDDRTTRPAQSRAFDPARTFEAAAGAVAGDVGTPAAAAELELQGKQQLPVTVPELESPPELVEMLLVQLL